MDLTSISIYQTNRIEKAKTSSGESTDIQRLNKLMVSQEEIFRAGDIEISPDLSR